MKDSLWPQPRLSWSADHAEVQARGHLHAGRRSAQGDPGDLRCRDARRSLHHAARRDRHRQDDDDGRRDPGAAAPDARAGPQQDAGRPALQRVSDVLPRQRGRVLRLLLRLLPARGVRPVERPLHREGLRDQRGGRPPAARRDRRAVRPPRRDHRRQRERHLRPRLARDLRDEHAGPAQGRRHRPRRAAAKAGQHPVPAQRHRARAAARSACAARRSRCSRPTRRRRSGRPCSATRSSACSTSTRSPAS